MREVLQEDTTCFAHTTKTLVLVTEQSYISLNLLEIVDLKVIVVPGLMAVFRSYKT